MINDSEWATIDELTESGVFEDPGAFCSATASILISFEQYSRGDFAAAESLLSATLGDNTRLGLLRPVAMLLLGALKGLQGKAKGAIELLWQVADTADAPGHIAAEALWLRAELLAGDGRDDEALATLWRSEGIEQVPLEVRKKSLYLKHCILGRQKRLMEQQAVRDHYLKLEGFAPSKNESEAVRSWKAIRSTQPKFDKRRVSVLLSDFIREAERNIRVNDLKTEGESRIGGNRWNLISHDQLNAAAVAAWLSEDSTRRLSDIACRLTAELNKLGMRVFLEEAENQRRIEVLGVDLKSAASEDEKIGVFNNRLNQLAETEAFADQSDEVREEVVGLLRSFRDAVGGQFFAVSKRTGKKVPVSLSCKLVDAEKLFGLSRSGGRRASFRQSRSLPKIELVK